MSPYAVLAHSNSEKSAPRFVLPKGVTLIKLGKMGRCFFDAKEYTDLIYNFNTLKNLKLPLKKVIGDGKKKVANPLYEMSNLNPNTGKTNNLLSGVYRIPLPFLPRRTKNHRITFNTAEEIRKAKNNSMVPIKRPSNNKGTDAYTLKQLVNKFHTPGTPTTFVIYACQAFNEGEFVMNNNDTIRGIRSYVVQHRIKGGKNLVTKRIQFGENALRKENMNRYINTLKKLKYKRANNSLNIQPGEYTVLSKAGRNVGARFTRSSPSIKKQAEMRKLFREARALNSAILNIQLQLYAPPSPRRSTILRQPQVASAPQKSPNTRQDKSKKGSPK